VLIFLALNSEESQANLAAMLAADEKVKSGSGPAEKRSAAKTEIATLKSGMARYMALPYFLMAAGPLGLVGAFLALRRRKFSAALLLILAAAGPAALFVSVYLMPLKVIDPKEMQEALMKLVVLLAPPLGLLLLAGLGSLLIGPARVARRDEDEEVLATVTEDEEEPAPQARRGRR
jgi:hypothetical protein